ncbi:hypothetical protein ACFQ2B_16690 [Streptomyces stramineus]
MFLRRTRARRPGRLRTPAVVALLLGVLAALAAGPAQAIPDGKPRPRPPLVQPVDPQRWRNPDDMTWAEYRSVPGTRWADPGLKPTQRKFKGALVLLDYPDEEFSVSRAPGTGVFGNPLPSASGIPASACRSSTRTSSTSPARSTTVTPSTSTGWRTPAAASAST